MKRPAILPAAVLAALLAGSAPAAGQTSNAGRQVAPYHELSEIRQTAESFLKREAAGLPGRVAIEVGRIDPRLKLTACAHLHAFFPQGSRAWGQTSVGVRCGAPSAWTLYVPARVAITSSYLVAARPLASGQEIGPGDFLARDGDLTRLPAGVMVDPAQVLGRKLANGVKAGQPLRNDALRAEVAVGQGQVVAVYVDGPGFRISSEGRALGKAPEGGMVQVRTASGAVLSGIVRPGPMVEVVR